MKKGVFIIGLILVLLISLTNYIQIGDLKQKVLEGETESPGHPDRESAEDIELGDVMTKLQRHSNKLWFAGKAANWPLAAFYIHELEESFEELTEHEIIEEGVNITMLTKQMGLKPLEMVEEAVKNRDSTGFQTSYSNLLSHCNTCHQSSNHPFVVITTPTNPVFDNQEYEIR